MPARASRPASIAGPAGALEALVDLPVAAAAAAAVVCHPHPLHGGTMHNKVAHTLAKAFTQIGAAAVRFNFRGVGASDGVHADGIGELDDALAVVEWTRREWPGFPLYLAGFSFGAAVALRAAVVLGADTDRGPKALVTVALPVSRVPEDLAAPRCPWLLVHGDLDEIVALDDVKRRLASFPPGPKLVVIEGATHFFHGKLGALSREVTDFLSASGAAPSPPSADVSRETDAQGSR